MDTVKHIYEDPKMTVNVEVKSTTRGNTWGVEVKNSPDIETAIETASRVMSDLEAEFGEEE